jgi:hypothetical protein
MENNRSATMDREPSWKSAAMTMTPRVNCGKRPVFFSKMDGGIDVFTELLQWPSYKGYVKKVFPLPI